MGNLEEKIKVPEIGEFFLYHEDRKYFHDYFGFVLERKIGRRYIGEEKGFWGLKTIYNYKEAELLETIGFELQIYDAFGVKLPKAGSSFENKIENKIIFYTEDFDGKEKQIHVGKEEIFKVLPKYGLEIFMPYLEKIIDSQKS